MNEQNTETTNQNDMESTLGTLLIGYSPTQQKKLKKRLPVFIDCLEALKVGLQAPDLVMADLSQMTMVLMAPRLSPTERQELVIDLYSQIHRNPNWTRMGNIIWVERMIDSYKAARKSEACKPIEMLSAQEGIADRKLSKAA